MNKIFDKKTIKNQLNNYKYVMALKTLSPVERGILATLHRKRICKMFPIPFSTIKNTSEAQEVFQKTLLQVERYIEEQNIQNPIIDNRYRYNALTVKGVVLLNDKQLIKLHQKSIKSKEDTKKLFVKNKIIQKKAEQIVKQCATRREALLIAQALKSKFNFSSYELF